MKTIHKITLFGIALMLCVSGCKNFEDLNTNPNGSTAVTPGMLATKLILPLLSNTTTGHARNKYMISTETHAGNLDLQYNALRRWDFGEIAPLRNVEKMINSAPEGRLKNSYTALGHFVRAYVFFEHTMRMGDIPYSEALQGENNNFYPAYDEQKNIFAGILNELDKADSLFASGDKFAGDPYSYGGDPAKWRRLVNAFELRVLINLSKRAGDTPELKVKERFAKIVADRPIFQSDDDNYMIFWNDLHRYNYYKASDNGANSRYVTSIIIDSLKKYNDRRLFYYVKPAAQTVAAGIPANSKDAYIGVDPIETVNAGGIENRISRLNERYTERAEGEPTHIITGFVEMNFILAEAAARGFFAGDAKQYYETAVRASMKYTVNNTPDEDNFHHKVKIDDAYINTYLQSAGVKFSDNLAEQVHQIIIQKYLALFLRAGEVPWFEQRRTGYPAWPLNPDTNRNEPRDKMPLRWMYPQDEYKYNADNVNAANKRQFNGVDDNNGVMWILK